MKFSSDYQHTFFLARGVSSDTGFKVPTEIFKNIAASEKPPTEKLQRNNSVHNLLLIISR